MSEVQKVLEERGKNYGSYEDHSNVAEGMLEVLRTAKNTGSLPPHLLHTFKLVIDKMVRAANGDYRHRDNLIDIMGYTQLSLDILDQDDSQTTHTISEVESKSFNLKAGDVFIDVSGNTWTVGAGGSAVSTSAVMSNGDSLWFFRESGECPGRTEHNVKEMINETTHTISEVESKPFNLKEGDVFIDVSGELWTVDVVGGARHTEAIRSDGRRFLFCRESGECLGLPEFNVKEVI